MNGTIGKLALVIALLFCCLVGCVGQDYQIAASETKDGFMSIFDGRSLANWHVVPAEQAGDWLVHDGLLVGKSSGKGSDLLLKTGDFDDFELKLSYRFRTPGNSGIHIRGVVGTSESHRVKGYHVDLGHVGIGPQVLGAWDFHGTPRGSVLVVRGQRVVIDESGHKHFTKIDGALTPQDIHARDWNEVHVFVRGHRLYFTVNGKMASEVTDNEATKRIDRGIIGLQLHSGRPMTIEFRDVRVKQL